MENLNNSTLENYGKCVHSTIYAAENSEFEYRKAYKGDWGDWDDQPENTISNQASYDLEELI